MHDNLCLYGRTIVVTSGMFLIIEADESHKAYYLHENVSLLPCGCGPASMMYDFSAYSHYAQTQYNNGVDNFELLQPSFWASLSRAVSSK